MVEIRVVRGENSEILGFSICILFFKRVKDGGRGENLSEVIVRNSLGGFFRRVWLVGIKGKLYSGIR